MGDLGRVLVKAVHVSSCPGWWWHGFHSGDAQRDGCDGAVKVLRCVAGAGQAAIRSGFWYIKLLRLILMRCDTAVLGVVGFVGGVVVSAVWAVGRL